MPDNWGYVFAAYGLAALVLVAYWRHLVRLDRALAALTAGAGAPRPGAPRARAGTPAPRAGASNSIGRSDERSPVAPGSGHPRSEPGSRPRDDRA
ncbi:MAG: hypothetical protein ACREM3_14355 [Candidatus Rokuibacteriota bacterium]